MFIHPKIRQLQENVNRVSKEYDIEDCVISNFNSQIGVWNKQSSWNIWIQDKFNIILEEDDLLVDMIYEEYNKTYLPKIICEPKSDFEKKCDLADALQLKYLSKWK